MKMFTVLFAYACNVNVIDTSTIDINVAITWIIARLHLALVLQIVFKPMKVYCTLKVITVHRK